MTSARRGVLGEAARFDEFDEFDERLDVGGVADGDPAVCIVPDGSGGEQTGREMQSPGRRNGRAGAVTTAWTGVQTRQLSRTARFPRPPTQTTRTRALSLASTTALAPGTTGSDQSVERRTLSTVTRSSSAGIGSPPSCVTSTCVALTRSTVQLADGAGSSAGGSKLIARTPTATTSATTSTTPMRLSTLSPSSSMLRPTRSVTKRVLTRSRPPVDNRFGRGRPTDGYATPGVSRPDGRRRPAAVPAATGRFVGRRRPIRRAWGVESKVLYSLRESVSP